MSEYGRIVETFERLLQAEMARPRAPGAASPVITAALALIVAETGHQISEELLTVRDRIASDGPRGLARRIGVEMAASHVRLMTKVV